MFELDANNAVHTETEKQGGTTIAPADLDAALAAQLDVAWAGERRRLGWWHSDMTDEYGGVDLLARLAPRTAEWSALEAARRAARRWDAQGRRTASNADDLVSLFRFGFQRDELLDERLRALKRAGVPPLDALSALHASPLAAGIRAPLDRDAFTEWVTAHGSVTTQATPIGRRITDKRPDALGGMVRHLVAALAPLDDRYPLPYWRGGA